MTVHLHMKLSDAPVGSTVRIKHLQSHPEVTARLREMGLCEESIIRCVATSHGNVICEVMNARIGVNGALASGILVASCD